MTARVPARLIRGAGGGGKGGDAPRAPSEAPDSLRSRAYARVLDAVSEGEIGGLVDGLKSIYLDDVPLQNPDGSFNFQGVQVWTRPGTPSQSYIPGIPASEAESVVGVQVKASAPVVRTISNASVTAVRVTVAVPALTWMDTNTGDLHGNTVHLAVDLQTAGGGYAQVLQDTISGKCSSRYQRAYRIALSGAGPWDIRVRRLSADSTKSNESNETWWDTFTEIIDAKLRYANTAVIGMQVDATHFRSIPRRGYDLYLLKVRVPVNYDPIARTYTGAWDGTFKIAWTDNPAWCFYDMATTHRYGLGRYVDPSLQDKWTLYSIGQYCDELVADGYGGFEPRFRCNLYLQRPEEALKLLGHMASIFRGMIYWGTNTVTAVADWPADAMYLFTPANVIDGAFEYAGSDGALRHTVALVTWNDPTDAYRQAVEYVEDPVGILQYGMVPTEIVAVGCTSRGQARRVGLWLLYTERAETETIRFSTGLEGGQIYPGAVFKTADPLRAGKRLGGRVSSATTTVVTLDRAVEIEAGKTYELSLVMASGAVESRTVSTGTGTTTTLTVASAFSAAPESQTIWVLAVNDNVPEQWRAIAVSQVAGEAIRFEVAGLVHNPDKFALVEGDIAFDSDLPSHLPSQAKLPAATDMVFRELTVLHVDRIRRHLEVSWTASAAELGRVDRYRVEIRDSVKWTWSIVETFGTTHRIEDVAPADYEVRVTAIAGNAVVSAPLIGYYTVADKEPIELARITGLELQGQDNDPEFVGRDARFEWRYNTPAGAFELGAEPDGADSGYLPILFRDYEVTLYDAFTGEALRVEHTKDRSYVYTWERNVQDGGPRRQFTIGVCARSAYQKGPETKLTVQNSAPGAPNNLSVTALMGGVRVQFARPTDPDFAGVLIWASATSGFTPSDLTLVYDGPETDKALGGLVPGITYYVRVAAYDAFGKVGLAVSGEAGATPTTAPGGITVVAALPTLPDLDWASKTVHLTTDNKLYRSDSAGTEWTTYVDGDDIAFDSILAAHIDVANLSAISADLGSITAGNITLNSAGFIKAGATAYATGTGIWMGYNGGAYKFIVGNPAGNYLTWNGTDLVLKGGLISDAVT
ncbi:MAG: hypothetical protein KIT73_04265, partial [Burkholderiales bacterium]|nr:hypothetical protein [Burkholderiales bacterium]